MKTSAAAIAAAGLCFAAGMVQAGPMDDCADGNRKALQEVEALYQGAQLPKPEQDRYKSLYESATKPMKPKGPGGAPLGNCLEMTKKIAGLKQALLRLITPQVGDRARGGIVFHVSDGGKHCLVAQAQDIDQKWRRIWWGAAVAACEQSTEGGFSDWILPNSEQLQILWSQRALVGGFQTGHNDDQYWSSSKMMGSPYEVWQGKAYFTRFETGATAWANTFDDGPSRPLFYARAIRKY
jgi:hypothetical protein